MYKFIFITLFYQPHQIMQTLTEHYKEKYFDEIYDFCLPLLKKSPEAVMCAIYPFLQLVKLEKEDPELLLNDANVKCFLIHTAKERCMRRLIYLQIKKESTFLYKAKAFFKFKWLSL